MRLHQQQLDVNQRKYSSLLPLYTKGHLSELEWISFKESLLAQQQASEKSRQHLAAIKLKIYDSENLLQKLPLQKQNSLLELETRLSQLRQQQAELMQRDNYQILAPVSGRVTTLVAREGQRIHNKLPQLTILPNGIDLVGQLFIPPRAIGFVKPGQHVKLLYDAFPYQHFGVFDGLLVNVSRSILTAAEISGPVEIRESAYIANVKLFDQSISAYGKKVQLQPGMTLQADIILEERSLIEWMLEPLYSLRGRT